MAAVGLVLATAAPAAVVDARRSGGPGAWPATSRPAGGDWWARVQRDLAEAEYHPSESRRGLQAPNRVHDFRTYFDEAGIRVVERAAREPAPLVALSLRGLGRGAAPGPVSGGRIRIAGPRVEIVRDGLVEWYENSARGLEQGFTVQTRPPGTGPLVVELTVAGARARLRGARVQLTTEAGRRLDYGKLVARDAGGSMLAARLEVPASDRIRLVVGDTDAAYPLVVDPLLTGAADAMLESDQPDPQGFKPAAFGGSVSSAGDVNGDGFDDVIVGAPGWDGGDPHEGAAFIFLGSSSGIVGHDPVTAHARIESDQFGAQLGTVAGSAVGDVNGDGFGDVVVGAHFYSSTITDPTFGLLEVNGAAFVFLGSAAGITGRDPATADAVITANQFASEMGAYVSGAGDVNGDGYADVLVGVPGHGTPFPDTIPPNQRSGNHGAALVFHGGPAGITGTGFDDADAVILSYEDTGQPEPPILGSIGSVGGAGDVNGDGFDDVVLGGSEIAVFAGSAGGVVGRDLADALSRVAPAGPEGIAPFTMRAAAAGDVDGDGFADVVAGAPFRDAEPYTARQEGAAFLFRGGPTGLAATDTDAADATFAGTLLAEWVGASVSGAGDVDGDGFDDLLVGAREYPGSLSSEGVAYLFRGGPSGIAAAGLLDADARLEARQSGAVVLGADSAFGVSGAGDVNGDGFDDVIVGKGYWDNGELNEGAAFVHMGGPWPADPNQPPVALAGPDQVVIDVDGDWLAAATVDGSASFDPDGAIVEHAWYEGEVLLGTMPVLSTVLPATGDHTLVLTVTDDEGVTRGDPVTVRVDLVDTQFVFHDGFGNLDGWVTGGDVTLASQDAFPSPPQVRVGAAGAFLRRAFDLPPGATGVTIDFWARVSQLAPPDELRVRMSVDSGPFATIRTFTSTDGDDTWVFYGGSAIPLGHSWYPDTASTAVLEFISDMSAGVFFVDDVKVTALIAPAGTGPVADAGPDRSATDADGDGLEWFTLDGSGSTASGTIVSYEWREGATLLGTGATLQVAMAPGVHVVTLTVTDDAFATDSDTATLTVGSSQVTTPAPGEAGPLTVHGFDDLTGVVSFAFEPACQAAGHNVVYGPLQDVASYGYSGQMCDVGLDGAGVAWPAGPGSYFFLVAGTDGVAREGSYGRSSDLVERPEQTADPVCAFTQEIGQPCPGEPAVWLALAGVPATIPRGDEFTVTATARNDGDAPAGDLTASIDWNPADPLELESPPATTQSYGTIAPGAQQSLQWVLEADREGTATITVTLHDSAGAVVASDQAAITVLD